MENASKALIIAGAILIAIVLITVGVIVVQQGQGTADSGEAALNAREIETFNAQFTKYEGKNISGSSVKQLINAVNSSNAAQANGGNHKISLEAKVGSTTKKLTKASSIKQSVFYSVDCTYGTTGNDNGYITTITVTGSAASDFNT